MTTSAKASIRRSTRHSRPSDELIYHHSPPAKSAPSAKALGKRPEAAKNIVVGGQVHGTAHNDLATRKATRILPNRSSRRLLGGGGSMVDELILDAQQRSAANKSILPNSASFLLTTDSSLVPPPTASGSTSVFDDPVMQHALKTQEIIQTPDFSILPESSAVGSRLRTRGTEEVLSDTSDQAYLARHRKFETLEKRQRLREKEKLQHERYKLKQRIEQLRAMDASAFSLALANLGQSSEPSDGERVRKELIREAEELEKRYDMLLSERKEQPIFDSTEKRKENSDPTPLKLKFKLSSGLFKGGASDISNTPPSSTHDTHPSSDPDSQKPSPRDRSGRVVSQTSLKSSRAEAPKRMSQGALSEDPGVTERRSKRPRVSAPAIPPGYVPDILRVAAPPNASRSTPRHILAFGVKIPPGIDDYKEFELPEEWIAEMEGIEEGEALGLVSTPFDKD